MNEKMILSACVTNVIRGEEGCRNILIKEMVTFPIAHEGITLREAIDKILHKDGFDGKPCDGYFITDYKSDIAGLTKGLGRYESLFELHVLASRIQQMTYDVRKLESMLILQKYEYASCVETLISLVDSPESFLFFPDIHDDYSLGCEYVTNDETLKEALKSLGRLSDYIDYESYGADIRLDSSGIYTTDGYICQTDTIPHNYKEICKMYE